MEGARVLVVGASSGVDRAIGAITPWNFPTQINHVVAQEESFGPVLSGDHERATRFARRVCLNAESLAEPGW